VLATAGAAAMAAPILIHLLARRRFKRIRWAAMEFLIDAERRNRRRIRMEDWILMGLRCLAVLLLGLLVARPFLSPAGLAAWAGTERLERVLVLDDSLSMGYRAGDSTSFERAKQAARRILTAIHEENPDDTVTLLRSTAPDKPIVAGAFLERSQLDDILARIEALPVSQRSMDLAAVFDGVADSLRRDSGILNAAAYLLSDFQNVDWARRGGGSVQWTQDLEEWVGEERSLRLVLVNLGEENAANTALTSVSLPAGQVVAGAEGQVRVAVANYSPTALEPMNVRLSVGNAPEMSKNVPPVGERQTANVELDVPFLRAGDESVRVDLPHDGLEIDDTRHFVAPVVSAFRVLVVDGEAAPDAFDDEVALFATALRPEGDVFSGFEVTVVGETGLEESNLAQFHVVVLANVFRLSEPAVELLEGYTRRGGGVLIFLGDQINPEVFNSTMYRFGEGLAPAELVDVVRPATAAHLVVVDRLHPALRAVGRDEDPLGLRQVPFHTFLGAKPYEPNAAGDPGAGPAEEAATSGPDAETGGPTQNRPPREQTAKVLVRFDDPDEHPAVVERSFGSGRVILIATSADKEWNLWPDHPTYLPVMMELVVYLTRTGVSDPQYLVGQRLELPVDPSLHLPDVTIRPPAFPNEPESFITAVSDPSGLGLVARWEGTETAGVYQFLLRKQDGGEQVRLLAVNPDPKESDLAMVDEPQLRRAMGSLRFEYIRGLAELGAGSDEKRTEIWPLALAFAVALLMTEQTLAWKWGRRH
jgi:hypothetical protein